MLDYTHYKSKTPPSGLLLASWIESPPIVELEAKKDFDQINKDELIDYFKTIISQVKNEMSLESDRYYNERISRFKRIYKNSENYKTQISQFKAEIEKKCALDDSLYGRAIKIIKESASVFENDKQIAETIVEIINSFPLNVTKLIAITDFDENTTESILNRKVYKKYIEKYFDSFEELFRSIQEFEKIIDILSDLGLLKEKNNSYLWIGTAADLRKSPKKLLCILAIDLQKKGYFIKDNFSDKLICKLIGNYFNMYLDNSKFGKYRKEYLEIHERSLIDQYDNSVKSYIFFKGKIPKSTII
jgi:hypothetical protein